MLCGHLCTFWELAGVKAMCLCSQSKQDLAPEALVRQEGALLFSNFWLFFSLQVNTSNFLGDPLGTLGESPLECVLGLEPGITPSRLPVGSLPRPWLAVMKTVCASFSLKPNDPVWESDWGDEV